METEKISELDILSTADNSDILVINDVSESDTKKITKQNLIKEVVNKANANETHIGDMTSLLETGRSNIVEAVNEVYSDLHGIIESGYSPIGEYIKFVDGTLIQWGRFTSTYTIDIGYGSVYRSDTQTITFPETFDDTSYKVFLTALAPVNSTYMVDADKTTTQVKFYPISYVSRTSSAFSVDYIAIGKWK